MLRRVFNNLLETAVQVQPETVIYQNPFTKPETIPFEWLSTTAPCFPINSSNIKILSEPLQFYNAIKEGCANATKRVFLVSLYLGTGNLETSLVKTLLNNENFKNGDLKINILLDYTRGSRFEKNSRTTLQPLLQRHDNCQISLYHTPVLRGILKRFTPDRWNELLGLQHMKLYVFDDTLVISGANLSSDYFTNRQDRYYVIKDKRLSDYYCGLVKRVQKFSLKMDKDNQVGLSEEWQQLPYEGSKTEFVQRAGDIVGRYLEETRDEENVHKKNGFGIGNFLHVFSKSTQQFCAKVQVFNGHKIHGIVEFKNPPNLIVFGGCNLCIYEPKLLKTAVKVVGKDWILAAKDLDEKLIGTVVLHNRFVIYNYDLVVIREVLCVEKCNIYSAFIHGSGLFDTVVFSGTIFSEILVWRPSSAENGACGVHRKLIGHQGVIFSIDYHEKNGYVCSSSDDRSTILWSLDDLNPICKVYGHLSRVFRSKILDQSFITAGEDSLINVWNFQGILLKKFQLHPGGCIWALDANDDVIAAGGGDSGITLFPANSTNFEQIIMLPENEVPKKIALLHSGSLVTITERGVLFHYVGSNWTKIKQYDDLKSYNLLEVSHCRNMFALAGYQGQIYIYKEIGHTLKLRDSIELPCERIFGFHWLNCELFLVCQNNGLLLLQNKNNYVTKFILPPSKERWSTCACAAGPGKYVVGDRRGNIHLFKLGHEEPIRSFKKIHSHLGITRIYFTNNKLLTLGRDATINFLSKNLQLEASDKISFTWLAAMTGDILAGFSGNNFLLWDYKSRRTIFETNCGGGHRSWDFVRNKFAYVKGRGVKLISIKNSSPNDLVESYHCKEINSLKVVKYFEKYVIISGGEDTTLRISLFGKKLNVLKTFKSHLSSIRSICVHKISSDRFFLITGGGRGQIIRWELILGDEIKCNQLDSYYEADSGKSEMRVMHLIVEKIGEDLIVLAGCSDGNIKLFDLDGLKLMKTLFYKLKCVSKVAVIISRVLAFSSDGRVSFWEIDNTTPFYGKQIHQSGINSYALRTQDQNSSLLLTGGDDNAIVLSLIKFNENDVEVLSKFVDVGTHCAQVTGAFLSEKYILTTSIDQKLAIFRWKESGDDFDVEFKGKYDSAVADIQGFECWENENLDVFLYGKGFEFVRITGSCLL